MAIQSNASTQEVVGGIKVYSGLTNVKVLAVNPTMAELHAMDINVKQEPNYKVSFSDQDYNKVVFWLANEDGNFKLEILMASNFRVSQAGKHQWINATGQSTWSEEAPSYEWWKADGQRKAYIGEETLINFVKAWANVANGDEVSFDTINAIASGDVTEIKELVKVLTNNEVRVLVGVKDDKYQQVYTKYFGRVKPQRNDLFVKALNDDYGSFNADFNADLVWGTHKPTSELISPDAPAEDEDWTAEPAMASTEKGEDLPF
jgi:hypothetical protein|tara:strand:+ start:1689 stop:2471 length:783 start_codon:yes stop_codon:yes gene_type:complete